MSLTDLKLPAVPESWHFVALSKQIGRKPLSVSLGNREIALYRGESGQLHAVSGRCPHMRAHLAEGKVCGERIVCPFHEWEFEADGRCARIPAQEEIPSFARVATYPVRERHGIVFLWYGPTPRFELPFFDGCDPGDFFRVDPVEIHQKGHWSIVPANAFDIPHLIHVHKRLPVEPPRIEFDGARAHVSHHYKIADSTAIDRLIRSLYGAEARLHFTVWGGNFALIKTEFGRFKNYMLAVLEPVGDGHSKSVIFVYAPGAKRGAAYRALRRPLMKFQAAASRRFFQLEADSLLGVEIHPSSLVQSDVLLKEYLVWLDGQVRNKNEFRNPTHHEPAPAP